MTRRLDIAECRVSRGPMVLVDSMEHHRGVTNSRYFRDGHDSTTG